jgi:hypothetical protein
MNALQHLITTGHAHGLIAFDLYAPLFELLERGTPEPSKRPSIFPPKRRQPRPDPRRSRQRKRGWASDSAMPRHMAELFTEGERAAVAVMLKEIRFTGRCVLPVKQIAALAGVGETTTRNATRKAQDLALVRVTERRRLGRPNLPNIVEVIDPELRGWLKGGGFKPLKATQNQVFRKEAANEEIEQTAPPHQAASQEAHRAAHLAAGQTQCPDQSRMAACPAGSTGPGADAKRPAVAGQKTVREIRLGTAGRDRARKDRRAWKG